MPIIGSVTSPRPSDAPVLRDLPPLRSRDDAAALFSVGGRAVAPSAPRSWAGDTFAVASGAASAARFTIVDGPKIGSDQTRILKLPKSYDGPIFLCDIDGTLRDTSVVDVIANQTQPPIAGSKDILDGVAARGVPIIYLSAGPELIHQRNVAFLAQLPEGILVDRPSFSAVELLSGAAERAERQGAFKASVIGQLKQAFPNAKLVGLGDDKEGDAFAYTNDGVAAFIHDIRPAHDRIPADFIGTLSADYDDAFRKKLFGVLDDAVENSASFGDTPRAVDGAARLSAVLDKTTGTTASVAQNVSVFVDGDTALPAVLAGLDGASTSICYQTFNFFDDAVGNAVVDRLIAAKKRGVLVRVVVDAFGARELLGHENGALKRLRAAGVEVRDFNPIDSPEDLLDIHRDHRKCVVIDGTTAFVGGMNTGVEYMGPSDTPKRKHDVMSRFEGPAVDDVVRAFVDSFKAAGGAAFLPSSLVPKTAAVRLPARDGVKARVLGHVPGQDQRIRAAYLALIDGAAKNIDLENSFPMEGDIADALIAAAGRGVSVRYIVGTGDGLIDVEAKESFKRLLAAGVRIFQYPGPIHTKALAVDNLAMSLGSSNVDAMSLTQDREIVLLVEDAAFTQRFTAMLFDQDVVGDARGRKTKELTAADLGGFWRGMGRTLLRALWPKKDE